MTCPNCYHLLNFVFLYDWKIRLSSSVTASVGGNSLNPMSAPPYGTHFITALNGNLPFILPICSTIFFGCLSTLQRYECLPGSILNHWSLCPFIFERMSSPSAAILIYFNSFLFPASSSTCICWMAMRLSRTSRSDCGRPSLMNTALRFSMFERQMSSLMVA